MNLGQTDCSKCDSLERSVFCDSSFVDPQNVSSKIFQRYKNGEKLFLQGNKVTGVYCIKSGKVKVCINDNQGNQTITKIVGVGAVLGYRSWLCHIDHLTTAEFLEDGEACFIEGHVFEKLLKDNPQVALKLSHRLAKEAMDCDTKNLSLVHHNVKERVCALLLSLSKNFGTKLSEGTLIEVKLTREEMASLIGTTSETMIRTISELKDEGLVAQKGKNLLLLNLDLMAQAANLS